MHGGAVGFTGMRALALAELYEDMEARCMEVFDNLADTVRVILSLCSCVFVRKVVLTFLVPICNADRRD